MTPAWAAIRVLATTPGVVIPALDAILAREGRVPFPPERVPPAYAAEPGEFTRMAIEGPDAAGALLLRPDAWRTAFARALALARALPALRLAAAVRPPTEPLRIKAYARGDLALAVGLDDDEELFYRPVRSDAAAIARLLAEWGLPPAVGDTPEAVWRSFAPGFEPGGPVGGEVAPRWYARASSRLVQES